MTRVHTNRACCLGVQAAEETVRSLMVQIKGRGCKENFQANPALLQNGQVGSLEAACYPRIL